MKKDPLAAEALARRAEIVKRWREKHPTATCSDATAAILADLEIEFSKGGAFLARVQ